MFFNVTCAPVHFFLHHSELESKTGHGDARPVESKGPSSPKSKTKYRLTNVADRSKVVRVVQ